jgi:hypothetical protein
MHWLHDNWPLVLGWSLYLASEIMPKLPNKAQTVVGAALEIGKAILSRKAPAPMLPEEPK